MKPAFLPPVAVCGRDTSSTSTCRLRAVASKRSLFLARPLRIASPTHVSTRRFCLAPRASAAPDTKAPKILIVGAPASGKGTQCKLIAAEYGVVHISTGDMLRAAVAEGTELGRAAKEYMDTGRLVPDELVTRMLVQRVRAPDCVERGWLLDGFPRTAAQADALVGAGVAPDAVLQLDVPDEVLVRRVVGRRLDPETGNIYHVDFNPPPADVAERCVQRSDDTEQKAMVRLDAFKTHAAAVQQRYAAQLAPIDGDRDKDVVFADVKKEIQAALERREIGGDSGNGTAVETPVAASAEKESVVSSSDGAAAATAAAATTAAALNTGKDNEADDGAPGAGGGAEEFSNSTLKMPVSEFVKKAEAAYEMGRLETENVAWSGQAGLEKNRKSTSDWADVPDRIDLAIGDTLAFVLFAYVGRANHGDASFGLDTILTALPFIAGWFALAPLMGAYMRNSTDDATRAVVTVLPAWALSIPAGLGLRALVTRHPPPAPFIIVSFIATAVVLCGWRVGYAKLFGGGKNDGDRRGNLIDGFKMVTTLLRRW